MIPEPAALDAVQPSDRIGRTRGRSAHSARSSAASRTRATRSRSCCSTRRPSRSSWSAVHFDNWFVWIAAFLLMGRAHAQFAALMHEAAHRLLVPQPQDQRLRRPLVPRLPVVHADRLVPARPHGAPPRRVRPRRTRHPAVPRLPDLARRRCAASSSATRPGSTGWKLFKGLLRRRASEEPGDPLPGARDRRHATRLHRDRHRAAAIRGSTSFSGSRRISPCGA